MGFDKGAEMIGHLKLLAPSLDEMEIEDMNPLLNKREKTHGAFRDVASISQGLKDVMRGAPNWDKLTDGQREALEMDAAKTARILCGDPNFRDHWDDKSGYSELGGQGSPVNMPTIHLDVAEALKS